MKTIKEVADLSRVSIRTLRYYDEIGLLKPTQLSEKNYRLYDNKALEKLQQIMFFRELEVPLSDIKEIMENPDYDKEQLLITQRSLLEKKRNRLNGLIDLISDVMRGVNTMSFSAFSEEDIQKILNHILECMTQDDLTDKVKQYGSIEKYREHLSVGFQNEKIVSNLVRVYGDKNKVVEAVLQSSGNKEELKNLQKLHDKVYRQLIQAKETQNIKLEHEAIGNLEEVYKTIFKMDNARAILLDLSNEILHNNKLEEITDAQYGNGSANYIAQAILRYYGV